MISKPNLNDVIEGKIEAIAFGGKGILRHLGFVIFVPFTAIGDSVTCRIVDIKKSFANAQLLSVQKEGKDRVIPPCPYFGTCGGCQIQHLNEQEQIKYKRESVKDALERIGHINVSSIDAVPAKLKWAYRRHITLHLRPYLEAFRAGYIGTDNQTLITIQTCPIFNRQEDLVIQQLQDIVLHIANPLKQEGRVTLLKNEHKQYILSFHFEHSWPFDKRYFAGILQHYPNFAGIIVNRGHEETIFGNPYAEIELEGLLFRITPQTFIQNHPEQSANIYSHICEKLNHKSGKKILDLYCGFGMTSLLLSKRGHDVTGVEYNAAAIHFAKDNAKNNKLHAQFIQGDVERLLPRLSKEIKPDVIIINPPRTGLSPGVLQSILLKAQPQEIIYVSCMPATLSRDLAILCKEKYLVQECVVYDMFPQTAHVETFVYLKKIETKK